MPHRAFAMDPNFDGDDQREGQRYVLLLRPAKIIARDGEYLCILRDVSGKGVRLRLFHHLPPGKQFRLELANGDQYELEKVWENEGQAGFTFVHATQLELLLEERSRFRKRGVRLRGEFPGLLSAQGARHPVTLNSLSQQGGAIVCEAPLAIDQRVQIEVPGLPALVGKVRWRKAPHYGLAFEQTFKLDQLAHLVAAMQPFADPEPESDPVLQRRA